MKTHLDNSVYPRKEEIKRSILEKYHRIRERNFNILFFFRFDDIVANRASQEGLTIMYDVKDKKSVNKIQNLQFDPVFLEYLKYEKILDIVECFTGPNILAIHNMLIAKPPDIGYGSSR